MRTPAIPSPVTAEINKKEASDVNTALARPISRLSLFFVFFSSSLFFPSSLIAPTSRPTPLPFPYPHRRIDRGFYYDFFYPDGFSGERRIAIPITHVL